MSEEIIGSTEPMDWNLSLTPHNENQDKLSGDITRLWDYPAVVWNVRLRDWKKNRTNLKIQCDIQTGRRFKEAVRLFHKSDYSSPNDLAGQTYLVKGHTVSIDKFERMTRWIYDKDTNQTMLKDCWVIRVIHDPGYSVRSDLLFEKQGDNNTQYRFYKESSLTETIIWSNNNLSLKDTIPTSVTLTSVKEDAYKYDNSRIHLDLGNELSIPTENDKLPLPVLIKSNDSQSISESPFKDSSDVFLPNMDKRSDELIPPTPLVD